MSKIIDLFNNKHAFRKIIHTHQKKFNDNKFGVFGFTFAHNLNFV